MTVKRRSIAEQAWLAASVKRSNQLYQTTSDRLRMHGTPAGQIHGIAAEHTDYLMGRSRYPARAVPYVTVGPGRVK